MDFCSCRFYVSAGYTDCIMFSGRRSSDSVCHTCLLTTTHGHKWTFADGFKRSLAVLGVHTRYRWRTDELSVAFPSVMLTINLRRPIATISYLAVFDAAENTILRKLGQRHRRRRTRHFFITRSSFSVMSITVNSLSTRHYLSPSIINRLMRKCLLVRMHIAQRTWQIRTRM